MNIGFAIISVLFAVLLYVLLLSIEFIGSIRKPPPPKELIITADSAQLIECQKRVELYIGMYEDQRKALRQNEEIIEKWEKSFEKIRKLNDEMLAERSHWLAERQQWLDIVIAYKKLQQP